MSDQFAEMLAALSAGGPPVVPSVEEFVTESREQVTDHLDQARRLLQNFNDFFNEGDLKSAVVDLGTAQRLIMALTAGVGSYLDDRARADKAPALPSFDGDVTDDDAPIPAAGQYI